MRISRIQISNFRNFASVDFSVGHHSVIVGENKIGKSNLVYALRLVLDPSLPDSARKLIATLNADTVTADLNATRAYLKTVKAARSDDVGVIGFCWGGGQSFRYATNAPELKAFVVCYGPSPNPADMAKIRAKGLGVYAENDARIDAGLPDAAAAMRAAGKDYPYTVYPGVGHGFFRTREKPEVADSAWSAVIRFFRAQLKS